MAVITQRIANMASGARKITQADMNRLNHLGLPDDMLQTVLGQVRKYATTEKGAPQALRRSSGGVHPAHLVNTAANGG